MIGSFGGEGGDEFAEVENHLYIRMRKIARSAKYLKEKGCNKLEKVSFRRFNIFFHFLII